MVHGSEPLDTRILGAVYHCEGDIVYAKGPECAVVVVEGHDILLDAEALYDLLTVALGLARDDDDGAREVYLLGRSLEVAQRLHAGCAGRMCEDEACVVAVVECELLIYCGAHADGGNGLTKAYALGMRGNRCGHHQGEYGENASHSLKRLLCEDSDFSAIINPSALSFFTCQVKLAPRPPCSRNYLKKEREIFRGFKKKKYLWVIFCGYVLYKQ